MVVGWAVVEPVLVPVLDAVPTMSRLDDARSPLSEQLGYVKPYTRTARPAQRSGSPRECARVLTLQLQTHSRIELRWDVQRLSLVRLGDVGAHASQRRALYHTHRALCVPFWRAAAVADGPLSKRAESTSSRAKSATSTLGPMRVPEERTRLFARSYPPRARMRSPMYRLTGTWTLRPERKDQKARQRWTNSVGCGPDLTYHLLQPFTDSALASMSSAGECDRDRTGQ